MNELTSLSITYYSESFIDIYNKCISLKTFKILDKNINDNYLEDIVKDVIDGIKFN